MSMCRVFPCVVGRGCLLWPVRFLGKTLLVFALLHSTCQGQISLLLQVFLDFYICQTLDCVDHNKLWKILKEMERVNVDILGISELKWTEMGEFNSDDHYIYYCGQEFLRRNGIAIMVNKRVWNAVLGYNLQNDRMISVRFQGKPFNITLIQPSLCPNQ